MYLCVQIKYHEEFEKSKIRSDAPPPENRQGEEYLYIPTSLPNEDVSSSQVCVVVCVEIKMSNRQTLKDAVSLLDNFALLL